MCCFSFHRLVWIINVKKLSLLEFVSYDAFRDNQQIKSTELNSSLPKQDDLAPFSHTLPRHMLQQVVVEQNDFALTSLSSLLMLRHHHLGQDNQVHRLLPFDQQLTRFYVVLLLYLPLM